MRLSHGREFRNVLELLTKEGQGWSDTRVLGQSRRQESCADFVTVIGYSILKKQ